jgi:hypothetical protein
MSVKRNKVVLVPDSVHVLGISMVDSISLFVVGQSPSVVNTGWLVYKFILCSVDIHQTDFLWYVSSCTSGLTYFRQSFASSVLLPLQWLLL